MSKAFPRFLGLIPARMGSKGVPGKNSKLLGDKPLIEYTIEAALASRLLRKVVVSTDCPAVAGITERFKRLSLLYPRPAHLASDEAAMVEVIRHALDDAQKSWGSFDYVVLLQPTAPFRMPGLVDGAIRQILAEQADSLVSLRKIPDAFHPCWAYWRRNKLLERVVKYASPMPSRRQDLPAAYYRDGQIYITRTSLVQDGIVTGGRISAWLNADDFGVNIDNMADWVLAENLLKKWKESIY